MRKSHAKAGLACIVLAGATALRAGATVVRFATVLGDVDVRLFNTTTPASVANFLGYVNRGDYQNTMIHKSVSNFTIQGGGYRFDGSSQVEPVNYPRVPEQPPVIRELKFSNIRGTLAYSRIGSTATSATSQWYFNLVDNPFLDTQLGGYAVFGRVVAGMDIVDQVAGLPKFVFLSPWDSGPMRNYTIDQYNNFVPVGANNVVNLNINVRILRDGDYNFDGLVNTADFTVLSGTWASTTQSAADGNGDGVVNALDFNAIATNFGKPFLLGSPPAPVPEPAAGAAVGLSVVAGLRRRAHMRARFA